MKRTLHEEAIIQLLKWKVRNVKRQNPELDDGEPAQQPSMKGTNSMNDLILATHAFPSGDQG